MLGAARETRGSIAAVVEAYRAHGLFERWPIEYLATHGDGNAAARARLALGAVGRFALALARHRRVAVHLHARTDAGFRHDALFAGAALAAQCPLVLQLHGAGLEAFYDGADAAARGLAQLVLTRAACVIAPSQSQCTWLRGVTGRHARVVCLPPPAAYEASAEPRCRGLVLFVGRLEPARGIYELLDAVAAVRPELPELRLVCAGDGDRLAVAHYAERLGIADAVKFTGWVGPSGKRALLQSAAVFALPAYAAALPLSLVEAMAAGLPVIASAVGGIPEAVSDGLNGYLVAPGDRTTLVRRLRELLLDPALAARLGAAARESARLRFAPERVLPALEEIYAGVGVSAAPLAEAPPRPAALRNAA
jgi:glycosyltransferase involved in cell wall biosynthesis